MYTGNKTIQIPDSFEEHSGKYFYKCFKNQISLLYEVENMFYDLKRFNFHSKTKNVEKQELVLDDYDSNFMKDISDEYYIYKKDITDIYFYINNFKFDYNFMSKIENIKLSDFLTDKVKIRLSILEKEINLTDELKYDIINFINNYKNYRIKELEYLTKT